MGDSDSNVELCWNSEQGRELTTSRDGLQDGGLSRRGAWRGLLFFGFTSKGQAAGQKV